LQIEALNELLTQSASDQDALETLYEPHLKAVRELQTHSEGLMRSEKERFEEYGKEVETLAAKLDYEIAGLKGRVEDVAVGVGDFEKGVRRVEERVGDLEREGQKADGWWQCRVM
jgi:predicted  nucleic acid-binding Zn-ribbon protein